MRLFRFYCFEKIFNDTLFTRMGLVSSFHLMVVCYEDSESLLVGQNPAVCSPPPCLPKIKKGWAFCLYFKVDSILKLSFPLNLTFPPNRVFILSSVFWHAFYFHIALKIFFPFFSCFLHTTNDEGNRIHTKQLILLSHDTILGYLYINICLGFSFSRRS
jgi:hypothetical protein